jgi:hypothetical protein
VKRLAAAAVIGIAAMTAACSKPQQPKVEMKSLDTAKGLGADVDRKAQDERDAIDKISK